MFVIISLVNSSKSVNCIIRLQWQLHTYVHKAKAQGLEKSGRDLGYTEDKENLVQKRLEQTVVIHTKTSKRIPLEKDKTTV
jgi:hypothetical protein